MPATVHSARSGIANEHDQALVSERSCGKSLEGVSDGSYGMKFVRGADTN
jgi:hypothetical protein